MAAVRNHLLSFSVLALFNAPFQVASADTFISLTSQQLTLSDLVNDYGYYTWHDGNGDIKLKADAPVDITILASQATENEYEYSSVTLLKQNTGYLAFDDEIALSVTISDANSAIVLEHSDFEGFKTSTIPQVFHVSLEANGQTPIDAAVTWSINESVLKNESLPSTLSLHAKAHLNSKDGLVAAIQSFHSDIEYEGALKLSAVSTNPDFQNAFSIDLIESRFDFISSGNTNIQGDIQIDDTSSVSLRLSHPTDRFEGRFLNGGNETGCAVINLSSGAQWITRGKNFINEFHWGNGGILDISQAQETVSIKTSGTLTGTVNTINKEAIANTIFVEDGAVLRTSINDEDIGKKQYKLMLGSVQPTTSDGSRIFVELIDNRVNDTTDDLQIGLIQVDEVKGQAGKLFVEAVPHYYETALGSFKTVASIGSDGQEGYIITSMITDLLGPSSLASNMLDFASGTTIAHEQNTDRVFSFVTDRLSQSNKRGLWVDARIKETELNLKHHSYTPTLETRSLTIGYDKEIQLPLLKEGSVGVWFAYNRTESDLQQASGKMDESAMGFYLNGISDDNYRWILFGHYGFGDNELESIGYFGNDHKMKNARFTNDSRSYGLGLYLGFAYPEFAREWFFEPFVSGYTYWVEQDRTSRFKDVSFAAEDTHQSLVKIGLSIGYRNENAAKPPSAYAQASWVHRFGKSVSLSGFEQQSHERFKTEDLQESWGYLKVGGNWQLSKNWTLSASASGFIAEVVKPKYEAGVSVGYQF